jgi:hypothetical protein
VVNNKADALVHPRSPGGYTVTCVQCDDPNLFHSLFYDVAERYADLHNDARGHDTEVVESDPDDAA